MNWIPKKGDTSKFEKLNEHRGSLKKDFKVKEKVDDEKKEITKVDHDLITHLKKREWDTTDNTALSYESLIKGKNDKDKTVEENADKLTGWGSRLMDGAKKTTAFLLKAACIAGLVGVANVMTPPIGMTLVAADIAAQEFPVTLKKLKDISPLQNVRDTIDNALIDDDKNKVAHKVVAKAIIGEKEDTQNGKKVKTDNKDALDKALRADQAAILDLKQDEYFILDALDNAAIDAETALKTLKAEEIKPDDKKTFEAEIRATMQKESDYGDAEDSAEATLKEKRLLVVRAMTENTDLEKVLKQKLPKNAEGQEAQSNIQKFLALEPTQMRQVLEAFHQKGFDPNGDDYKALSDKDKIDKFKKFNKVMALVQTNKEGKTLKDILAMPEGTNEEKAAKAKAKKDFKADIQENDNALGDALWQHETAGTIRLVGMTGRKIWEKSKAVRDTLFKWSPQMKTVAAVGAMAAGHAAVGHFKPKTS